MSEHNNQLAERLPAGVDLGKWTGAIIELLESNDKCLACSKESIVKAVYEAATSGLPTGCGLFSFVPWSNDLAFQIGYKGMIWMAIQSGQVRDICARVVHEGDDLTWEQGVNEVIKHKPSQDTCREDQPITHVYVIAVKTGGPALCECWTKRRLDQHEKDYVPGGWKPKSWQAMAKKTLVRQLFNSGRLQLNTGQVTSQPEADEDQDAKSMGWVGTDGLP